MAPAVVLDQLWLCREGTMLVVDVGNSKTKAAWFDGEKLRKRFIFNSHECIDGEYLKNELLIPARGEAVAFSCVVPRVAERIRALCHELSRDWFDVKSAKKQIVKVNYAFDQLGGDRLANAAAGFRLYEPPLLVVDFGTATTYNVVLADGTFDGGIIAPGIKTCIDFLIERSGLLPGIPLRVPRTIAGRTSEDALVAGFYFTFVGQFKEISERIEGYIGNPFKTIGTGGMVAFAKEVFPHIVVNRDLTLLGIKMLYEENRAA